MPEKTSPKTTDWEANWWQTEIKGPKPLIYELTIPQTKQKFKFDHKTEMKAFPNSHTYNLNNSPVFLLPALLICVSNQGCNNLYLLIQKNITWKSNNTPMISLNHIFFFHNIFLAGIVFYLSNLRKKTMLFSDLC